MCGPPSLGNEASIGMRGRVCAVSLKVRNLKETRQLWIQSVALEGPLRATYPQPQSKPPLSWVAATHTSEGELP